MKQNRSKITILNERILTWRPFYKIKRGAPLNYAYIIFYCNKKKEDSQVEFRDKKRSMAKDARKTFMASRTYVL